MRWAAPLASVPRTEHAVRDGLLAKVQPALLVRPEGDLHHHQHVRHDAALVEIPPAGDPGEARETVRRAGPLHHVHRGVEAEGRLQLDEADVVLPGVGVVELVDPGAPHPGTLLRPLLHVEVVLPGGHLDHGHVQLVAAVGHGDHHAVRQQGPATVVPVIIVCQLESKIFEKDGKNSYFGSIWGAG